MGKKEKLANAIRERISEEDWKVSESSWPQDSIKERLTLSKGRFSSSITCYRFTVILLYTSIDGLIFVSVPC